MKGVTKVDVTSIFNLDKRAPGWCLVNGDLKRYSKGGPQSTWPQAKRDNKPNGTTAQRVTGPKG